MSALISPALSWLLWLSGIIIAASAYAWLRRPGATLSLAVWFLMPGLLVLQGIWRGVLGWYPSPELPPDQDPLLLAAWLCALSLLAILRLAWRRGARVQPHATIRELALVGAAGAVLLAGFGAVAPAMLVPVCIGVAALYVAPSVVDDGQEQPLAHAAGVLWALLLGALSAYAVWLHAGALWQALYDPAVWPSEAWLREEDAAFGRTLVLAALTGLSGLFAMVACLGRSPRSLERDGAAGMTSALLLTFALLGGGVLLYGRVQRAEVGGSASLRALIAQGDPLPSKPARLDGPDVYDDYIEWFSTARCAVVPRDGGWQLVSLVAGVSGCEVEAAPAKRSLFAMAEPPCELDPSGSCRQRYPLLLVPGAMSAQEVARSLAQSRFGGYLTALAPTAPTRHLRQFERRAWPFVALRWERGQRWRLSDGEAPGDARAPLIAALVTRGGGAQLMYDGLFFDLGPDMSTWRSRLRLQMGDQRFAGELGIVLDASWTVQDVVDRCAALAGNSQGCVAFDAPPEELAALIAAPDPAGR